MPFDSAPLPRDLLDLATSAREVACTIELVGSGLARSHEHDGAPAQARGRIVALKTLSAARRDLDALICDLQVKKGVVALYQALDIGSSMMRRHLLGEAAEAFETAGVAHAVEVIDDALERIGGDDGDLRLLLAEMGG